MAIKHVLTPRFILRQYAAGKRHGRLQAATLFVDISGFTVVTEALMQHGKAGAETLAGVMQVIFTPLIAAVYERGGFIAGFAGDAFTAVFPGRGIRARARAVDAAWMMRQQLGAAPSRTTPYGTFTFTGRVGVAAGAVNWGIPANGDSHTAYFRGGAVELCVQAEHLAAAGDVVVAAKVGEALSDFLTTSTTTHGDFRRLTDVTAGLPLGRPSRFDQLVDVETAAAFHPQSLLTMQAQGEFRQVVSVFVNLKINPRLPVLAGFMQTCFVLLRQYDGYLCRLDFGEKGCNLLLFWGAPTSHENDIERALNFLLALQSASSLPLRAGVTYQQVFAGFAGSPLREEYTCYGLSVNQSVRQMMAAPWGQLWLDVETARRADLFDITSVGTFPFKGFTEPQSVFQLVKRRETVDPFYRGVFAGRQAELTQLKDVRRALDNGRFAGVVLVSGEAGIGKSRLVHEFLRSQQAGDGETQHFICRTDEILRRPLNPFRYWLRRYFGQSVTKGDAANKDAFFLKLAGLITAAADADLQAELERTRSFLGALVDLFWPHSLYEQLQPALRFENTITALKTLLRAESLRRPLILVVEDGQWLDEESRQFLQRLSRNMEGYPLVVLLTGRDAAVGGLFAAETAVQLIHLGGFNEAVIFQVAPLRSAAATAGRTTTCWRRRRSFT
ncbi:MAG: AAA family ATPase, partial [Anaerolineae bacterium]